MKTWLVAISFAAMSVQQAMAHSPSPVSVEIVAPDGGRFQSFPVNTQDGSIRSYLLAEKGARYAVYIRNNSTERIGVVVAVDGRNIINGQRSELKNSEPMYVLEAHSAQAYAGWRASLSAINEFYFTDWSDSYAEAFGDRTARGVIAIAVYRETLRAVAEPKTLRRERSGAQPPTTMPAPMEAEKSARADASAGTGYGDRRVDQAVEIEFAARSAADSRHFIKYEWRDTLCRKRVMECGEANRFWDESKLGFAPPPPRRR